MGANGGAVSTRRSVASLALLTMLDCELARVSFFD
jgi:hypothetical protein